MTFRVRACTLAAVVLVVAACSGSESSTPATTGAAAPSSVTTAPDESESADDVGDAAAAESEPEDSTAPPTTSAVSSPPTTEAAPPPTTEATVPATTAPPVPTTTEPLGPEIDVTQFCFESEQAYLANVIVSELTEPTPAQAEAALQFLVFAAEQSVATAPPGFGEEATRFLELVREFDELFGRYDYDVEALDVNEDPDDYEPLFVEYEAIIEDELIPFLEGVCMTELTILDDQGIKIAPLIGDASDWPLIAATNQSGDIRLLIPTDWDEIAGSVDVDEVTFLQATPDTEGFEGTWTVPGVIVTVFYIEAGVAEPSLRAQNSVAANDCSPIGTEPYSDALYTGELSLYQSCSDVDTGAAVLAVTNDDESIEVVAEFQFPGGVDRELLDQMLASFAAGV